MSSVILTLVLIGSYTTFEYVVNLITYYRIRLTK